MMTMSLIKPQLKLSAKFRHFMRTKASVEFLEGTTAAGKTTVGIPKFMLRVADSNRRVHLICAKTIGVLEKNILNGELGLLTQFEGVAVYNPRGAGDTRLHISCIRHRKVKRSFTWPVILTSQNGPMCLGVSMAAC